MKKDSGFVQRGEEGWKKTGKYEEERKYFFNQGSVYKEERKGFKGRNSSGCTSITRYVRPRY